MKKLSVQVLKEDQGYSAQTKLDEDVIFAEGESFEELKSGLLEAINLSSENTNKIYSLEDLSFEYDLESFFSFYKVINAKALSERIGMNQSLLAQYIKGIKKPSTKQLKRIIKGVQDIGKELTEVELS